MKKLLILFLLISLLAACDNNPFANNNRKKDTRDKNEKNDRDKDDGYDDEDDTRSNWTKKQRNEWMDDCTAGENDPEAKQICSCVLKKIEKKYPDLEDAKEAMEEVEGLKLRLAKECGYKEEDEHGDYDNYDIKYRVGSGWTNAQREQFIDQCATKAMENLKASEARSYCPCMQNKIEKKYKISFAEIKNMNLPELSTPDEIEIEDLEECLKTAINKNQK